jgi:predicted RNA-binding Zn-ribbon protein involved in translation (DUF1610 family)
MSNPTARKVPTWKRLLFFAVVLIGFPVTAWAIREQSYLLAACIDSASLAALFTSITVKRCPSCGERLFSISYPASHCPKCGSPYTLT